MTEAVESEHRESSSDREQPDGDDSRDMGDTEASLEERVESSDARGDNRTYDSSSVEYNGNSRSERPQKYNRVSKSEKPSKGNYSRLEKSLYKGGHDARRERTDNGAVAYIVKEDGTEAILEQKPARYAIPEQRYKDSLPGGAIDAIVEGDSANVEDSFTTLLRELEEETENPKARQILLDSLKSNGKFAGRFYEYLPNGNLSFTDVYIIKVANEHWDTVRSTGWKDGSGPPVLYTRAELMTESNDKFAFNHGQIIKTILSGNRHGQSYLSNKTNTQPITMDTSRMCTWQNIIH